MNSNKIVQKLIKIYPKVNISLNYSTPFQLLICLILAAQCTDKRVNQITKNLFDKYTTPNDFILIGPLELENLIHSCGFYKNKAKYIKSASKYLIDNFNSVVPNDITLLQSIPGIGRKSANCIMSDYFNNPQGIAIDTHAKRICNRLGLSNKITPNEIEQDLLNTIDKKYWKNLNLIFVTHGREICHSKNPKCNICKLNKYCNYCNKINHNIN